jgi:Fe2+ transport system protein FeoA
MNLFHQRQRLPGKHHRYRFSGRRQDDERFPLTLLDVPLGCRAKIGDPPNPAGLSASETNPALPGLEQLQAYGLASGYWVRVLQRTPVIVLQIDHLELAMEKSLAAQVIVEEIGPFPSA